MKEAMTVTSEGDTVSIEMKPEEDEMEKDEDAELKAAFKAHDPVLTGNITFARTFEDMERRQGEMREDEGKERR